MRPASFLWIPASWRSHRLDRAFAEMREASRRLYQSLFDAYDPSWVGEEDLGSIVEVSETTRRLQMCRDNKILLLPVFINNESLHGAF